MRKPAFCLCAITKRICFRKIESTLHLLSTSEISSLKLCLTWSETPKTGFPIKRLNYDQRDEAQPENVFFYEDS